LANGCQGSKLPFCATKNDTLMKAAYQGLDRELAAETMTARTRKFLEDVRDIFIKDVFPDLKLKIRTVSPDKADDPGFWDSVVNGVSSAIDSTSKLVETLVIKPAVSSVQTVARVTGFTPPASQPALSDFENLSPPPPEPEPDPEPQTVQPRRRRSKRTSRPPRGAVRILKSLVQRVRYSRGPH
ncbi:MAG: hypothetical protein AAF492_03725, partial [Verrucomicrobiota bacterium]